MSEQTYAGHTLAEIKAAAEAATPGPWQIITDEHPHYLGRKHRERRVFTTWKHPQLGDFAPVVNGSVGIPSAKGEKPIHMVSIEANNANHIAAANPATVLSLAARIEYLEQKLASANADHTAALRLVAEVRHAIGDDGKRMQDELVQYVGELVRDAARYRRLRDLNGDGLDVAIDVVMEQTKNREGA